MLHGYRYGYRIRYVSDTHFPKNTDTEIQLEQLIIIYKYHIDIQQVRFYSWLPLYSDVQYLHVHTTLPPELVFFKNTTWSHKRFFSCWWSSSIAACSSFCAIPYYQNSTRKGSPLTCHQIFCHKNIYPWIHCTLCKFDTWIILIQRVRKQLHA